jgi:hypothetical protein
MRRILPLLLPSLLLAQLTINPVQDYINKTTLLNRILSNMRSPAGGTGSAAAGATAQVAPAAKPAVSEFRHSGAMILPKRLGNEAAFAPFVTLYEETARKDRFPANEVAYALTYFVVNSYMTLHDLHAVDYAKDPWAKRGKDSFDRIAMMGQKKILTPTPLQERAVFLQFREALERNAGVAKMTDAQKQEMTELLAITFGVNFGKYMDAVSREDERAMAAARAEAAAGLEKLFGFPAATLKINESGFSGQ